MQINSAILRRLSALNLPTEAFQEVLSILAELTHEDEERRKRNSERMRAVRELCAHSAMHSTDVPLTYLDSPKKEDIKEVKKVSKGGVGVRLLDQPISSEWLSVAKELGASEPEIGEWYAEFTDYWMAVPGHRGVKLDWLRTWRNNVRRKIEWRGKQNGKAVVQFTPRRGSRDDIRERNARALDRVIDFSEGRTPSDGFGDCFKISAPAARGIPPPGGSRPGRVLDGNDPNDVGIPVLGRRAFNSKG